MRLWFATAIVLIAAPAGASSIDIGVRLAAARAGGDATNDQPMRNQLSGAFSFGVDTAYRVTPELALGIYAMPTFGVATPSGCPDNASCSGAGGQAGFEARYRFLVPSTFEPWIAAGLGVDVLQRKETVTKSSSGIFFSSTTREEKEYFLYGPTLLLQAGGELRVSGVVTLGPWIALGLGQYWGTKYRLRVNGDEQDSSSGGVDGTTIHTWLFFGARGAFEIHLRR